MKRLPVPLLLRHALRGSATRALAVQHQLVEWELARTRLTERQLTTVFELYRTGLVAGRRFTEVFAESLGAHLPHAEPPAA